jgi:hypothetical protein
MENPLGAYANCCDSFERFLLHQLSTEGILRVRDNFDEKNTMSKSVTFLNYPAEKTYDRIYNSALFFTNWKMTRNINRIMKKCKM